MYKNFKKKTNILVQHQNSKKTLIYVKQGLIWQFINIWSKQLKRNITKVTPNNSQLTALAGSPQPFIASCLSCSMKGIRWPTAFFITLADLITWGKNIFPAPNRSPTMAMPCDTWRRSLLKIHKTSSFWCHPKVLTVKFTHVLIPPLRSSASCHARLSLSVCVLDTCSWSSLFSPWVFQWLSGSVTFSWSLKRIFDCLFLMVWISFQYSATSLGSISFAFLVNPA